MSVLTVGQGQQFATIESAVASGDTINVSAGTYNDDFALVMEIYSTTVLTTPVPGDLWS
jgi:hypothetical protein